MRSLLLSAVAAFACAFGGIANADPAYKAQDIIKHFDKSGRTGATRGICIGTEAECGTAETNAGARAGFDLLITFDLNSAELTQAARENLGEFAKALNDPQLSGAKFEVDGHTDARGEDGYNMALSERRAEAVVQYLASIGVDASKLVAKGFGKSQPRSPDPYDAVNRRVETKPIAE